MFMHYTDRSHLLALLEDLPTDSVIAWNEESWGLNVATLDGGTWWLNGASNPCGHEDVAVAIAERATDTPRVLLRAGAPV